MCNALKIGDRVYYTDNGPDDTGTIDKVEPGHQITYGVDWDFGPAEDDTYMGHQLTKVA